MVDDEQLQQRQELLEVAGVVVVEKTTPGGGDAAAGAEAIEAPPASTDNTQQQQQHRRARTIVKTRSSRQLMRQISALGMEDPVFQTKEATPQHPSCNIFDDMSVSDLPPDMRDMVSVASDRTANTGEGLDLQLYAKLNDSQAKFSESLNSSSSFQVDIDVVNNASPEEVHEPLMTPEEEARDFPAAHYNNEQQQQSHTLIHLARKESIHPKSPPRRPCDLKKPPPPPPGKGPPPPRLEDTSSSEPSSERTPPPSTSSQKQKENERLVAPRSSGGNKDTTTPTNKTKGLQRKKQQPANKKKNKDHLREHHTASLHSSLPSLDAADFFFPANNSHDIYHNSNASSSSLSFSYDRPDKYNNHHNNDDDDDPNNDSMQDSLMAEAAEAFLADSQSQNLVVPIDLIQAAQSQHLYYSPTPAGSVGGGVRSNNNKVTSNQQRQQQRRGPAPVTTTTNTQQTQQQQQQQQSSRRVGNKPRPPPVTNNKNHVRPKNLLPTLSGVFGINNDESDMDIDELMRMACLR